MVKPLPFLLVILPALFLLPFSAGASHPVYSGSLSVQVTADPEEVCQGAPTQLTATATGGTEPYSYLWYPSAGINDTTIADPVATPLVSTWYHVRVIDAVPDTVFDSILIVVITAPPAPGTIFGPGTVCVYSSTSYTINPVSGATSYSWTVPAGAVITDGQNTPSITVHWDTTGGTVSVIAGNNCGLSIPSVLLVEVFNAPQVPQMITGPDHLCENSNTSFSVEELPEIQSYFWTVPQGSYITGGQGTNVIDVLWGPESGNVSVVTQNPCGNSLPKDKYVITDSMPQPPEAISGKDTVCRSHSGYIYTTTHLPNTISYKWVLPPGTEIVGVTDTNTIELNFSSLATSGDLTVYGMNDCGAGPGTTKYITVTDCIGINDDSKDLSVTMIYDPASEALVLTVNRNLRDAVLTVYGIDGRIPAIVNLHEINAGESYKISLANCTPGLYVCKLASGNLSVTEKFIHP